jgi:hypothetical protein
MSSANVAKKIVHAEHWGWCILLVAMLLTSAIYSSGLSGGYLFDDYPNIIDNHAVQPTSASVPSLVGAALSSSSSEFKRPLASLSFAANYLVSGLDPYWMKLTNLLIHLLNGLLVFLLSRSLLRVTAKPAPWLANSSPSTLLSAKTTPPSVVAAFIAMSWMLLPINLTAVLYVVQRMESMANLFVLLGLIGYVTGRHRMISTEGPVKSTRQFSVLDSRFVLCLVSLTLPTILGILAKETAVMLPLYALLVEWLLFHFALPAGKRDWRVISLFLLVLLLPMVLGLAWMIPGILKPEVWATRDFTLHTRLLSEARIVTDYVGWTVLPMPNALSFYHDDFLISSGLLKPWTTLTSTFFLVALIASILRTRRTQPLLALGIALFLSCQLLTGTVLPLELIYEHRNYFASFGLMLAGIPLLAVPRGRFFSLPRHTLLAGLLFCWVGLTSITAYAWGNPLRLAQDLASRAPLSPRAQYELGRTYIIYSHYDPSSPFTRLAYQPLERSSALPNSSILPEQALIFMNARMHLPLKDVWWDSIVKKLKSHKPASRMIQSFEAALSHPDPSSRLLANYGNYAWNALNDHELGERMLVDAVTSAPNEPAYQITLIRMLIVTDQTAKARAALDRLETLNIGGRLNQAIAELRHSPGLR